MTEADPSGATAAGTTAADTTDGQDDAHAEGGVRQRIKEKRAALKAKPGGATAYRIGVGVIGGLVLVVGIIAIPYPGPGWALVIAGLAILASEFTWAQRVLTPVKRFYHAWTEWLGRQSRLVQGLVALGVGVIVLATLWLVGALGLVGGWFGFEQGWLQSPLGL